MVFITAGMGGGTGTGAAPVIARAARELGILTVGVVTKPFQFEGVRRMRLAESGINELQQSVDTLIVIPNQNLFRVATEKTTFADAFAMADQVLYSGVACITDLMVKEGLINLDFADVRSVMRGMGKAMMGTGEASGENRAIRAAEAAIANPLLDDVSMKGARGLLISITGGNDLTLYELDEAATRIREEVDQDANIILGATFDESLEGIIRVSVVATGIDQALIAEGVDLSSTEQRISEVAERLRAEARARVAQTQAVPTFRAAPAAPEPVKAIEAAPAPMPAPVYAPLASAMEPAPQPVVRDDVVLTPAQPKQAMVYEAPADAGAALSRRAHGSGRLHPAPGRAGDASGADAADRRIADTGAEPDPRQPRRTGARTQADVAAAAARDGRVRTQGRGPSGAGAAASARGSAPADVAGSCGIRQAPDASRRAIVRPRAISTRREEWLRRRATRKTISWRFRPSCAARRTDRRRRNGTSAPSPDPAGGFFINLKNFNSLRSVHFVTERNQA